jgi:hypothetical protein
MKKFDVVINEPNGRTGLVTIEADRYSQYEGVLSFVRKNIKHDEEYLVSTFASGSWRYVIEKKEADASLSSS